MEGADFEANSTLQALFTDISDVSCVTVTIIDDDAFESNHTFTVTLSSLEIDGGISDPNLAVTSPSSTEVTIIDNDGKTLNSRKSLYECTSLGSKQLRGSL